MSSILNNSLKSDADVEGECRNEYISAMKAADNGDFDLLFKFVRQSE